MKHNRGSTLVESALALTSWSILMAGIMELGFTGLISNSVSFAAQRAARYASVRGRTSGHAASTADIQSIANQAAAPISAGMLTVTVTWTPDNNPGSTVQVKVACSVKPALLPLSATPLTLRSTAAQTVVQ